MLKRVKHIFKSNATHTTNATTMTFDTLLKLIAHNNQHIGDAILEPLKKRSDLANFRQTCKTANAIVTSSRLWQQIPALGTIRQGIQGTQSYNPTATLASLLKIAKIFEVTEDFSCLDLKTRRGEVSAMLNLWHKLVSNECLTKQSIESSINLLIHFSSGETSSFDAIIKRVKEIEQKNPTDLAARKTEISQYLQGMIEPESKTTQQK